MGFHVPRVTIKVDFKKETSFGELSIISLGYGLHQAWIYSSMFDKSGIFGAGPLQAGPLNDQLSLAYFVSILVYGLLLLVASAIDTKLIRSLHSTSVMAAAAVLGAAGTLLLLVPDSTGFDAAMINGISGVLTGAGSSVLLLVWGVAFSRRDSASIIVNGALSIAIGFGIYGLVLHQVPFPVGGVLSALIPFAEFAILLELRKHVSLDFDNRMLVFQPLPINHARFVLRFGLPVFFLGVALGILRQTSIETVLPGSNFNDQALLFVTACLTTVLIMITFLALGGDERWHTFFRPLVPFIAVTAAFIPFTANGNSVWSVSVVLVGYMSFEALMWIFFAELAQRFRLSPIFVFGLGRGVMALAALGGSTIPLFTGAHMLANPFGEMGVVLTVVLALMVAYALLPDEREMAAIVNLNPQHVDMMDKIRCVAPLIEVREDASQGAPASIEGGEMEAVGELGELGEGAGEDAEAACRVAGGGDTLDAACEAAALAAGSDDVADGAEAVEAGEAAPVPVPQPVRFDPSRSIFADVAPREADAPALDEAARRGRFRERCEIVANTYLLSRRENEVMYYLARGYKSSFIQRQLYISEGTAKTHIRHIYRKLNIHSQQELIHLIDEVEL